MSTDGRNGRALTAEQLLCVGLPEGMARLARFSYRVRHGKRQSAADVRFLATAFDRIVAGADVKKELDIAGKQHQGRKRLTAGEVEERYLVPAVEVYALMKSGVPRDDAIDRVASERRKEFSFVEDAYKRQGETARWLLDVVPTWAKK